MNRTLLAALHARQGERTDTLLDGVADIISSKVWPGLASQTKKGSLVGHDGSLTSAGVQ